MSQIRKYCVTITILYTRYTIIVNLEFKQHVFSAKCLSSPWINAARAVLATRAQPVCRDAMIYAFEAGLMLVNYERKCQWVPQHQVGSTYCARIHLLSLARSSWTEFVKGREHTLFEIKKQHVSAISRKEGKYGPVSKAKHLEIAFTPGLVRRMTTDLDGHPSIIHRQVQEFISNISTFSPPPDSNKLYTYTPENESVSPF